MLWLFLLPLVYCQGPNSEPDPVYIPELETLTKVLSPDIVQYPQFHNDFHTECRRRNVSVASYANTCFGE